MSFDAESLKTYGLYAAVIAAIGIAIYMVVRFLKKDRYEDEDEEQFLGLFGNEKYDEEDSDEEDSDEEEGFDDSDSDEEEGFDDSDSDEDTDDEVDDEMDDESYDDM